MRLDRSTDARIAVVAPRVAIRNKAPPKGCIHHSDRGSKGGFNRSSQHRPELIVARRRGPWRAFSNQAFCAVCR